jgi:DNA-directed RNA polymerase sigma subunit (sigma70/sigma32)
MEEGEAALRMLRRALQRHGDAFIAESTRQGMLAAEAEREYERALVMAAWDYGPGGRSSFLADGVALLAETRRLLTLFTELRHFARELWRDKGRQATPDELAQGIGHTVAFVSRLLRWRRRHEQMELQQESDEERRSKLDLAKLLGNPGSPRRHDPHRHDREALEHERQIALAILAGRQGLNALSTGSVRELGTEASRRPLERAILVSKGHSAHVRLVAAYTPLVSHMARGFAAPGLSLTGLIAQGTAGLIEAVDNPSELGTTRFAERAARAIHRALSAEAATQRRLSQIPMPLSAVGGSARATLSEQVRRGPGSWEDEGGAIWRASAKERADWLARVRESAGFLDRSVDELERSRGRAPAPYIEAGRLDMAMLLRSPDVTTCEALLWLSVDEARAAILAWGLDAGAPLDAREIDRRLGGSLAGKREIKGGAGKMIRQAGVQL